MTIYSFVLFLSQFLNCHSFHVRFYYFLICIQVSQETGEVVWYSHLFKNFPQFIVIHMVKSFCVDVFLEFSCFIYDPRNVGNLISVSSAFSKPSLNTWKFSVHVMLKPNLKVFEHNLTSIWNEHNAMVVWTFFGIAFLWDWKENWSCPVLCVDYNKKAVH